MDIFLLLLRLALAGVFGVAGIAKALDPEGSKKAFVDFGAPLPLAKVLVYILPAIELAIAVSLLFVSTSWYGALGGTALLLVFITGMLVQLAKGNAPDCHCFGQIHSEPVGVASIARNIIFLIPAGILSVQGKNFQGHSLVNSDRDIGPLVIGLAILALLVIAVVYLKNISQEQIRITRRIEILELVSREGGSVEREDIGHPRDGLPLGALVPDFEMLDLDGQTVSLNSIQKEGKPILFIFVGPNCAPCAAMREEFAEWEAEFGHRIKFVFIATGEAEENRAKFAENKRLVLIEQNRESVEVFRARWTPMAVLMDTKGRIASFTAAGDTGIRELIDKIRSEDPIDRFTFFASKDNPPATRVRIGEKVPAFSSIDITGRKIDQDYFSGGPTLVAFWSEGCQFCGPMMDEIIEWETQKNGDGPQMLVFGDGDGSKPVELGLKSPMILDAHHHISDKLGQYGTPSGILIDEDGRFVSETAVGSEDIWALIGRKK